MSEASPESAQAIQAAWRQQCDAVTEAMKQHTRPFIAPLSTAAKSEVRHVGNGTFIEWHGRMLLITCEHVSHEGALNFSFFGSDEVQPSGSYVAAKSLDVAFASIEQPAWQACSHKAATVPSSRIAESHRLARPEELLFFHGFAGENSHYGFGVLESSASAYVTQQSKDAVDDARIFELLWEPQETTMIASTSETARKSIKFENAGGFSGSLVWNTRFFEVTVAGREWTPECAVVTGLLLRWDTGTKTLLARRIEHVRNWLMAT